MAAILGIDAAWTSTEPSGVALIVEHEDNWQCVGLAPSYHSFIELANGTPIDWTARIFPGTTPDPLTLLDSAQILLDGERVDVVAVDMPLSLAPISGRRVADDHVAHAFGANGCSPHSPSIVRPGGIGVGMRDGFAAYGFPLMVTDSVAGSAPALLEVYPHPALLALLNESYRIKYKVSRSTRYWPGAPVAARSQSLLEQFVRIRHALSTVIAGIDLVLPTPGKVTTLAGLKRYEDALDALVCAWVGTQYLAGHAKSYGDNSAAIWIPVRRDPSSVPKGVE